MIAFQSGAFQRNAFQTGQLVVDTHDGGGRRRKRRKERYDQQAQERERRRRALLEAIDGPTEAAEEIVAEALDGEGAQAARAALDTHTSVGGVIDWRALIADVRAVRIIIDAAMAEARLVEDDDDDEFFLMMNG